MIVIRVMNLTIAYYDNKQKVKKKMMCIDGMKFSFPVCNERDDGDFYFGKWK